MTPLSLQTSFQMITKNHQPNDAKRGRMFETALMRLTQWWYEQFQIIDYGHVRSQTYDEVQKQISAGIDDEDEDEDAEILRSPKSLMKHAIMREGSRDVSAQLFTSLCRALGIPARLVVSLQSVPWQAKVGKPTIKTKSKVKKKKAEDASSDAGNGSAEDGEDGDMEEVMVPSSIPADSKGKAKVPQFPGAGQTLSGTSSPRGTPKGKEKALPNSVVKLRKSKPQGRTLGSGSSSISRQSSEHCVFQTEIKRMG